MKVGRATGRVGRSSIVGSKKRRWAMSAASTVLVVFLLAILTASLTSGSKLHDWVHLARVVVDVAHIKLVGHPLVPLRQTRATGPLIVNPANPRYFADGGGKAIYLTGSHTWLNLQDAVISGSPYVFDYSKWLDFLQSYNHNFFRLWVWEQAAWVVESRGEYQFTPNPYQRTGPGKALDGKPKFDLTRFNQEYFDRLRERVAEAGEKGIYVSIMLFNGFSIEKQKGNWALRNPWHGHPFNAANNINGVDGDPNHDDSGVEVHSLQAPPVVAIQEAYVSKVIDTVNDLDNVLYEIANESAATSVAWQYHMIDFIHSYEARKPKQHPVLYTTVWGDSRLWSSRAEAVSDGGDDTYKDPPPNDGRKIIINDTDHIWGIGGDRDWVWKSFTRGLNPIFMDQYDDGYRLHGGGYDIRDRNDVRLRQSMGYTLTYAMRMNLAAMTPRGDLASTGYCLANASPTAGEYLIYSPKDKTIEVDLSASPGQLTIEWFSPRTGYTIDGGTSKGGRRRSFQVPFGGDSDAVLYIHAPQ
jgi:Family of unknown function (DUF6298)/Putative collagen-binding domain of a collagenase